MLAPYKGRVYDPCNGSGGLFVQSEKFIEAHGGKLGDIAIYGQESNPTTWKLALMNLAIRGIEGDLGKYAADTFRNDLHPDLKAANTRRRPDAVVPGAVKGAKVEKGALSAVLPPLSWNVLRLKGRK